MSDGTQADRPGDRPLHVHHLIDALALGGAELLLPELASVATTAGLELSVGYLKEVDGSPAAELLRKQGVDPILVGVSNLDLSAVRKVRRHVAAVRPDLVHTHLWNSDLMGGVAAWSLGIPFLSTIHTLEWKAETTALRVKTRLAALARRRCAARVLAVSESTRRTYLDTGWDVPSHVTTLHNGVVGRAAPGSGSGVREELGLRPSDLVVGMLSSLRPEKGYEVAVEAVRHLAPRFSTLRLLIVGDGPARPEVERLAATLGPVALVPGYRADVMAVLDAIDVLAQPSRTEALPTSLLLAMAASVPVVAGALGGIPEIVRDRETGLLFEAPPRPEALAAALAVLLADREKRRLYGANGRKRFERCFTAERWAACLKTEYDRVLERR